MTWTTVASTDRDTDSPITQTLIDALYLNPIAIADGDASAPRIRIGALQRLNAGSSIRSRNDTVQNTSSSSAQTAQDLGILQKGTVTITLDHKCSAGTCTARVRRVRNGVNVDVEWTTGSTAYVSRSTDVNVEPGDLIRVMWFVASGAGNTDIRNIRLQTNGEDYYPVAASAVNAEGNTYN